MSEHIKISLAAARVNAGMTQRQAAKALGISTATLVSWEKNKSTPRVDTARRISELYKIPLANIFLPE